MMFYTQKVNDHITGEIINTLYDDGENVWVINPETRFWQAYLAWIAEGNEAQTWE